MEFSEMARKMRERKASKKSDEPAKVARIRLEDVLPRQIDDCDEILGYQVFWDPIARSIKEKAEGSDDWNDTLLQAVESSCFLTVVHGDGNEQCNEQGSHHLNRGRIMACAFVLKEAWRYYTTNVDTRSLCPFDFEGDAFLHSD